MGSSQSSIKYDELPQFFTTSELAAIDISISKKEQYKNHIPELFSKFQFEYRDFYNKRRDKIIDLIKSDTNNERKQEIRTSINILIIIGSSLRNLSSKYSTSNYLKNAEDLNIALLIRHLFHYSFGISYNQILITSTQNSDFTLISTKEDLISKENNIYKEIHDTNVTSNNYSYKFQNYTEKKFMLDQNINVAQIKDKQYKFYLEESIKNIINPFNINIIEEKLPKKSNSDLFVFLLDHENKQGFGGLSYQFIIERLLKIQCKHFFIFNDSHFSGSIIKIIDLCKRFNEIFPDINDPTLESALFYFLSNLNKVYSSDKQIVVNISNSLNAIDNYDINDEREAILKSMLQKINKSQIHKISKFIFELDDEFRSMGCVPQHFIQFSKKSTILASSDFNQISLTLPGREFSISSNDSNIRIFGSIFSSIIIESFLNKKATTSLMTFRDFIYNQYSEYKKSFMKYIKQQNENIEGQTLNSELAKEYEIEEFFSPKSYKDTHYFSSLNDFPELQTILYEEHLWNFDITQFNSDEYKSVHFSIFPIQNDKILKPLTAEQFGQYDIPNAKQIKEDDPNSIQSLFTQFSNRYQTYFCKRTKAINNECILKLNKKFQNIRGKISILIIIGSSVNYQESKFFKGKYQKNAEDLDTALLIRHLFHYAFGIPFEQILVTSTQRTDFIIKRKQPKSSTSENNQNENISDYEYNIINEDEFMFYQNINVAQIGKYQYKFYLDENIKNIIKPFDIKIIKNELVINEGADLFVFFLDHGYAKGFDVMFYQFIIEHLLELDTKQFIFFNDSCYSGSLIKLIKICQKFRDIFPDINDQTIEKNLFHFLISFNKVSLNNIHSEVITKISSTNLDENTKNYIQLKIQDSSIASKISEYLSNLTESLQSIECVPDYFIQFSKRATIFASSEYKSFTLPGRKFDISIINDSNIRIFGSIFSSIIIESFLNKNAITSLMTFKDFIYNQYSEYKKSFMKYIKQQNENIEGQTLNSELAKEYEIEEFFSPKSYENTHYFSSLNDFPELQTILYEEHLWNFDITQVNSDEYKDVRFCIFNIYCPRSSDNYAKYGPAFGTYYIDKFVNDFKVEVNILFEKYKIQKELTVDNFQQPNDELIKKSCPSYGKFISLIKKLINSSNYEAVKLLKIPIAALFKQNSDEYEKDAELFAQAFKNVILYWEGYDLET